MIEIVIVLAPLMLSRGLPLTNKRTVRVLTKGPVVARMLRGWSAYAAGLAA
jgi:hypothetical protein